MLTLKKLAWMAARPKSALAQIRQVRAMQVSRHVIGDEPFMQPAAIQGLRGLLGEARLMVEYGAGGSTIMAALLGVEVVSVEGDHNFANAVIKAAGDRNLTSVKVLKANFGWTLEWSYPFDRYPSQRNIARWREYVELPWRVIGVKNPDVILVDGRARKACVAQSVIECLARQVTPPIILDDYVGRARYAEVLELVRIVDLWDRTAVLQIRANTTVQDAKAALGRWITDLD